MEKLKDMNGEVLYTHHLDATIDILRYLLDHMSIHLSIHPPILYFI